MAEIDLATRELVVGDVRLGRTSSPADMQRAFGASAEAWSSHGPNANYRLGAIELGRQPFAALIYFLDGKLKSAHLEMHCERREFEPFSDEWREDQQRRHDAWLDDQIASEPSAGDWISSVVDPHGAGSYLKLDFG